MLLLVDKTRELGNAAGTAQALQFAVDDGNTGRIIAAVLETLQSLKQHRHNIALSDCRNDSTHRCLPLDFHF
jgi:hypothetical protein